MKYDLSILIPANNEEFLSRTVEDILSNIEGKTEIIVVLDGGVWANPPIADDPRVTIIYHARTVGQRAAQNEACRVSRAKYVMKVDAHCAFDKGFDVKMMEKMQDNYTMIPLMKNLHVFDWACQCGHRIYQGGKPKSCEKCGGEMEKDIVWIAKHSPKSCTFRFDRTLHFQYWKELEKRQEGDLIETMSIQGSAFMCTRERYWAIDICDESWGSWGQQGVEVACKTWLSGGRVVCNRATWYAHLFRTQEGFRFPYHNPESAIERIRKHTRDLFLNDKWEKAIHPFQWLLDKFAPIPDWHDNKKGIIFFTDNKVNLKIAHAVQSQLKGVGLPITSASLKPMNFGMNVHLPLERGYLTMFKQILAALEASTAEIVFFCEHDVIYHPTHFDFVPEDKNTFYYNTNVWKVRSSDGLGVYVDNCRQVSGLCVYREAAITHYRERVAYVEANGYDRNMGFEPGTHGRVKWKNEFKSEAYFSKYPNVDIRHDKNLTPNRFSPDLFRNKKNCEGWTESKEIPGWGSFEGRFV